MVLNLKKFLCDVFRVGVYCLTIVSDLTIIIHSLENVHTSFTVSGNLWGEGDKYRVKLEFPGG